MSTTRTASLHARPGRRCAALFAGSAAAVTVDEAAGVIRDVAVMTVGPAKGHGFEIDQTTLKQTFDLLAAMPDGARVRLKHPEVDLQTGVPRDGTGTTIGRLRNPRLVGTQIRGDVHLGAYAANVPGVGDCRSYFLRQAAEDPTAIGLSTVIHYDVEPQAGGRMPARVYQVDAVDFAEDPAANPRGLLSALPPNQNKAPGVPGSSPLTKGGPTVDPILELLKTLGLDPSATTAEQIGAFVATLTPEQRAQIDAAGYKDGYAPAAAAPAAMNADGTPKPLPFEDPNKPAGLNTAGEEAEKDPAELLKKGKLAAKQGGNVAMLEAQRATQIRQLGSTYRMTDFAEMHVAIGTSAAQFVNEVRQEAVRRFRPTGSSQVSVGEDRNVATLAAGIGDGLRMRSGQRVTNPHERSREFSGRTMVETCRAYLSAIGVDTRVMSGNEVARLVFNRGRLASLARAQLAHTTSDFSNILQDTIGKTLRTAYAEAETTWQSWVRKDVAPDFRTISRTQLSEAPDLELVKESGEYKDGKISDAKETYVLYKYGRVLTISWEAVVNDDLSALNRIPTMMGMAAKRKEDDVVYYALLRNAALADTVALFHATHGNLATGAGAPSVATLNTAVAAMAVQRGPEGKAYLNLTPKHILIPPALAGTTWELLNSTTNPASNNSNVKNRFGAGGMVPLDIVQEARLQLGVTLKGETVAGSATAWYLAASNSLIDTMELSFLAGEEAPVTEEEDGFRVDGRSYKIRHCMEAKAIDYRGLYKHAGS